MRGYKMSAYKNTANDYNNVHDNVCSYIKNRQDLYSKIFDKLAYNLLFSENILSLGELVFCLLSLHLALRHYFPLI